MTQKQLKSIVKYNRKTGLFTYVANVRHSKMKIGQVAGGRSSKGYIGIRIRGKNYLAHRLAFLYVTGKFPHKNMQVDHVNMIKTDNLWTNLRLVTPSLNCANRSFKRKSKEGYVGVRAHYTSKFTAWATINNKPTYIGAYKTAKEAGMAYIEFLKLNGRPIAHLTRSKEI